MRRALAVLLIGGAPGVVPVAAEAAWSPTTTLEPPPCGRAVEAYGCLSDFVTPRVAVRDGRVAAVWSGTRTTVGVALLDSRGRVLVRRALGAGDEPAVALGPGGRGVAVWTRRNSLVYARLGPGRRIGPLRTLVRASRLRLAGDATVGVGEDGTAGVVYESRLASGRGFRLRALRLAPGAVRAGRSTVLGREAELDGSAAGADGRVVVCCTGGPREQVKPIGLAAFVPRLGPRTIDLGSGPFLGFGNLAVAGDHVLLGSIVNAPAADGALQPTPQLLEIGPTGEPTSTLGAGPVLLGGGVVSAADGSGRRLLIGFPRPTTPTTGRVEHAPLAVQVAAPGGPFAEPQPLADGALVPPLAVPYGDGALVAWQRTGRRWGIALERDGTLTTIDAPAGAGPASIVRVDRDLDSPNRSLAADGSVAALAWTSRDAAIHISVRSR